MIGGINIKVEDTGCGIKAEDIPRLFSLYGKLECSVRINKSGVGLGLSISQSLLKHLNQSNDELQIKVFSECNKGSSFSFNLYSFSEPDLSNRNLLSSGTSSYQKISCEFSDLNV